MTVKALAKRVRHQPLINRAATSTARAAGLRSEFWASHLPRQGHVTVDLPEGPPIQLWSDADDWSTSRLWWHGYKAMEAETIDEWRQRAATSQVVLDIGAHVGWYALLAAQAGAQQVHAFEPHPAIAVRCGMNVALNPWRITVHPDACSDKTGPVDFHIGGAGLPSSSGIDGLAGSFEKIRVGAVKVDDIAAQWDLGPVDLVKIDVEGHEPAVLAGMADTLRRDRPALVFEMIVGATTEQAIAAVLDPIGYRYWRLTADGPVEAASPVPPTDRYCNYLAEAR